MIDTNCFAVSYNMIDKKYKNNNRKIHFKYSIVNYITDENI